MSVKLISSAILIAIMCQLSHQKSKDDTYKDCETGESSRCFGLPDGCVSKKNCMVLLSADPTDLGADFTLFWTRDSGSKDRWVGAAISADNMMGDDSVTECILQKSKSVLVRQGLTYCSKGVNGTNCGVNTVDSVRGITKETGSFNDNVLTCSWSRADDSTVKSEDFNIYKQKYYILLAYGPTDDKDVLQPHTDKWVSKEAVILAQAQGNGTTTNPTTGSTAPATPSTTAKPSPTGTSQTSTGSTAAPTGRTTGASTSGNTTATETGATGNGTTSNPSTQRKPTTTSKPSGSTSISFNLTLAIFVTIILSLNL